MLMTRSDSPDRIRPDRIRSSRHADPTRPDPTGPDRLFTLARLASLAAALALVAQSEWSLSLAVGWPAAIAWAAPVALDSYVIAAIRSGKDLGASVIVSAVSVIGSHAVYAAPAVWAAPIGTPNNHLVWYLAGPCSIVPLLVTWRAHHLPAPTRSGQEDSRSDRVSSPISEIPGPRVGVAQPNPTPIPTRSDRVPGVKNCQLPSDPDPDGPTLLPTQPDPTDDPTPIRPDQDPWPILLHAIQSDRPGDWPPRSADGIRSWLRKEHQIRIGLKRARELRDQLAETPITA